MHGAKEISASLKTYNIPKKKAKKDTQPAVDISKPSVTWKDALPGSAEFKSIEEILSSSEYRERNLRFKLDNVKLIENHFLKHRFETYRQKLKENRQPSGETVAFIQLGFEDAEREYLALNGVAVGASFNTDLGNPEHGVYLFNKFDLVSPQPLFTESDVVVPDVRSGRIKSQVPLRILICKVLRGRQYTVGLGSTDLDPVPGYGCHVVQRNTMEFPRTSLEKYRNNAIYVYEHDDALGIVEVPSGILPYAVVDVLPFSSKECKSIKEKLDNRNLPVYNPTNPLYVGQFTMLSRQFVLTLVGNANDAAKVLGIDPSLDFYIMQSWEMLSENGEFVTPFQELLTSKCGQLATTRELELSRGGNFVAYFMLQCLDRSPEEKRHFAEFCDRVRLERGSLCCATFENFRVYCIPSSELTARMGFAWPREPTMHLLMQCKKRSFYFEPGEETMSSVGYSKEAMRRNPTPNDYVKGSDWLLKDMADEAYRLIAETTGNKGHNHIWRCINPDKQFPRPADLEKLPEADWDKEPMQAPPPKPQRRPAHAHPPPTPDSDSTPASVQSRQEEDMDIDEENQDSQDSPSPSVHQVDPRRVRSPPPHAPPQNDENPRDPRSFYRGDPRVQPPRPVLLGTPGDPRLPSGVLRDPRRPQHSGADYPPKDPRSNQHVDGENEMGDCVVVEYADSQSTDADDERSPLEADERRSPEMAEIEIIQLSSDEEEEEHAMDISEPEQEEEEPGEASPGERDGEPTDSLDPRSPSSSPAEECGTEETGNEKVEEVEIEERSATPDLPPVQKAWMWDPRRRPPPKKCPRHAETQRPTASVPPRQQPSPTPSPVLLLELPQQAPPRDAPMLPFEVTPPPPPPLPTRFTRPWQWPRPVVYPVRPPPGWGQPGQGGGFPVPPPIPPPGVPPPPHHSPPGNWMAPHLNMPPPPLPSNGYFNNGPRQDYFNGGFQLPQHQPPFMNNFGNNVFGPQGDTWRRSN